MTNSSPSANASTEPSQALQKASSGAGSKGVSSSKSLAAYASALESICTEIDAADGEISDEIIQRFDDAKLALADKTDRWIGYLDASKWLLEALKDRKERAAKAFKTMESAQRRLKDYLKFVLQTNPDLTFKGTDGTLYLHKNAESVKYAFAFEDKTFYSTVDVALIAMEPTITQYVKSITVWALDGAKVKADLKAGKTLPWAELQQDCHARVKG